MAAFRTITNSVANIPLTYVHYVSIDYLRLVFYGDLQLSRHKPKSLTAKANSLTAKENQLNAIFLPSGVPQFSLQSSVYILLAITICRRMSGFGTPLLSSVHIDRDQKKPVKHDIYPQFRNEITEKLCACSLLHLEIYDISRQ